MAARAEPKGAKNSICFIGRLRDGQLSSTIGRQPLSYEKERGENLTSAPYRGHAVRLSSYCAREPSVAKSTNKSYLVFGSFWLSSSLRASALLAKPLAWRVGERASLGLCAGTHYPEQSFHVQRSHAHGSTSGSADPRSSSMPLRVSDGRESFARDSVCQHRGPGKRARQASGLASSALARRLELSQKEPKTRYDL
jgi:hypothetical protein